MVWAKVLGYKFYLCSKKLLESRARALHRFGSFASVPLCQLCQVGWKFYSLMVGERCGAPVL